MRQFVAFGMFLVAVASMAPAALAASLSRSMTGTATAPAGAARGLAFNTSRRIDVNRINLPVSNVGVLGWNAFGGGSLGGASMVYPTGSGRTALTSAGLWLGGRVGAETRVTVARYSSDYGPGAMVGGAADDPGRPEYRVYKVVRWTGSPSDSAHVERSAGDLAADPDLDPLAHHSWSEYMSGAAPHGAPWRTHRLPDTATPDPADSVEVPGPDVLGDQMLWCVFNDADPALHGRSGDGTAPLGIEVRQTSFAFDRPGPLGSTVFIRYDLRNRGSDAITEMRTSLWGNFDIGAQYDDLAGCMESRSLGYMYNDQHADWQYAYAAPALGFDLLAEHDSPTLGRPTGMDAFVRYRDNAFEPGTADEMFNALQGLESDGSPVVDPSTGQVTTFMVAGDPVVGTGWIDAHPIDRRIYCTSGPWALAPGDSLTLWVALVIGQADTPIGSVAALRCADDYVQSIFDAGFAEPFPAPPSCIVPPANCPRSSDWWTEQCTAGTGFSTGDWLSIAYRADSLSVVFDFTDSPKGEAYCAMLSGPWPTARDSAKRDYLALLSNVAAGDLGLIPGDGQPARLARATQVAIPPVMLNVIGQMVQDKPDSIRFWDAVYDNRAQDHRRAYGGVNVGLPYFEGGAGTGWDFFGGTIDPTTMPDSFAAVELRFSHTATQRAYRFLRLAKASDGGAPPQGRAYLYAGFHDVNFTCWDVTNDIQLDVAFMERCLTADDGTILGPSSQPATFDSTWAPDASDLGGREYLFVLRRPYDGNPKVPHIGHDEALTDNSLPLLYALWARLRFASDVVDDGDVFRFEHGYPPTGSAERLFQWLEPRPLSDSSVVNQYRAFAAGAADVNRGLGIGAVCGDPTPVAGTLIEARTEGGFVTLRWRLNMPAIAARLETRTEWGAWLDAGPARIEGNEVTARDERCSTCKDQGRRWHRLAIAAPIGLARTDSVSLTTSFPTAMTLVAVWPNPSVDGRPRVEFVLPEPGTARLEVYDLTGRRVSEREVTGLDVGTQFIEVAPGARLRAGVYFVRLSFGSERRSARMVVLN